MPASAVLRAPVGAASSAGQGGRGAGTALAPATPPWAQPEGQHGHLQPPSVLGEAAGTSWGCGSSQGTTSQGPFSLERRQEILFHREEFFLYEPYQQIHVLKVLAVAEGNFTTCYNTVVHLPSLILDFGKLNIKLVDLVLIGAVINTENFH